jgi:ectoine hydroxylase-related dioxygenase (phytanoyl-CoA dioxygenase family)
MLDQATIQQHVQKIETDGYSIIPNAVATDFLDSIIEDLGRLERELDIVPAKNRFEGTKTVRIYNLLMYGKLYERIPVHENVLPIVERVLDPGCLVSSLSSISICGDEKPQPMHADDQLIPLPRPHVPIVCNTMWALTDFTDANGATRIVPGSHKWAELPDLFGKTDSVPAEMRKGSVMVYNGSLWHGGGSNRTRTRRVGVAMNYCAGYIRQQENQQLGIPREIAAQFSPRLQELVGYSLYNGLIGHIDKSHPMEILGRKPESAMVWDVVVG